MPESITFSKNSHSSLLPPENFIWMTSPRCLLLDVVSIALELWEASRWNRVSSGPYNVASSKGGDGNHWDVNMAMKMYLDVLGGEPGKLAHGTDSCECVAV